MEILNLITENALIFIPVIYIIGMMLKGLEKIQDKFIPLILLPIGVALAMLSMGLCVEAFIQGVLVVGAAVYTNQLIKQIQK